MTIQDLCREKRAALNMTAQDIADASNVPLSTVNNFFANSSKAPSINTVGPICAVLGISLDEFFGIGDSLYGNRRNPPGGESRPRKAFVQQTADHYDDGAGRENPEPHHCRFAGFIVFIHNLCVVP